jgi:hypothetical protein
MRKMNAVDSHITELETRVLDLVRASPLAHHTHPTLLTLHKTLRKSLELSSSPSSSFEFTPSTPPAYPSLLTMTITKTTTITISDNNKNTNNCEYYNNNTTDQSVPVNNVDTVCSAKSSIFIFLGYY